MQIESSTSTNPSSIKQYIFLLSHMRANTSLISHILGSHPQINGYYEMHQSYLGENDIEQQLHSYASNHEIKKNSSYFFDKILHNKYHLLLENLSAKEINILVSIRSAEQSIKSIVNLFQKKDTVHTYANPKNATKYYIERIAALAEFCQRYKGSYHYYDAELIRIKPKESLKRIQTWLSLETPLTEQYQIFSHTGQARKGDSSDNIKTGKIIAGQTEYNNIEIASHLLQKAEAETSLFKQQIIAHAIDSMSYNGANIF